MNLELILKDIEDVYVRENFTRLTRFVYSQGLFDGNFKFFEIVINQASIDLAIPHGLTFIPEDIIFLSVEGNHNFYFNYQAFDRENFYITADGACRLRFFAGKMSKLQGVGGGSNSDTADFPFVPPSGFDGLDDVQQYDSVVRIDLDSLFITESERMSRTFSSDCGCVTTITGTQVVAATGVTIVEAGSTMRLSA